MVIDATSVFAYFSMFFYVFLLDFNVKLQNSHLPYGALRTLEAKARLGAVSREVARPEF